MLRGSAYEARVLILAGAKRSTFTFPYFPSLRKYLESALRMRRIPMYCAITDVGGSHLQSGNLGAQPLNEFTPLQ